MIDLSHRGDVAVLTMAHGKANAFDLELSDGFVARLDECRASSARAVVITGRGAIFSAGVDLLRVVSGGAAYVEAFLPAIGRTFERLFAFPKPVVAAINGHAIAGGCILACAADYRLMVRGSGRIGVPELLVGVPFPTVALEIMRFATTHQVQTLLYGGGTFAAEDAVKHRLVDTMVEADGLLDGAIAAAEVLAARRPAAFALTKQQLREPARARIRAGTELFDRAVQDLWSAPATLDAIRVYIEKTFKKPASNNRVIG